MNKLVFLFTISSLLLGCGPKQRPSKTVSPVPPATATPTQDPVKARASEAFQNFAGQLKSELTSAIESGGPVQAVEVCHARAPEIARSVSEELQIEMGRSSHRPRNTSNAPQPEVSAFLEKYRETPAAEIPMEVYEVEGGKLVVAPIPTAPLCLTCHGDPQTFSPDLKAALAKFYPEDQATGFDVGDMRGVFWARMKQGE